MRATEFSNRMGLVFWLVALSAFSLGCSAKETLVTNQAEFESAVEQAKAGDSVILANGVWEDFEILFKGKGTENKPITLRAEEKGKVILSGESNLRLAGEYLVVSGLVFKNGYTPTSEVISFRRTKGDLANHSRVTEVVIDNYNNPERTETDYWVSMYGKHNRFDHNHLEGKRNRGVTMAVRLDSDGSIENHHQIDHNYFGPRTVLGSNGGETLRIGTSAYSLSDSFTVVENNYFDRCDGELEIISNKSGGNVFRGNVFFESRGTLTMRHGNGNLVENNVFFGNGVDHTGGIRVINADQTIRNNYMEGLAGYRFGGALVVMNGVPNSSINRYHQVSGALIENNSVIDSDHIQLAAGSDQERSAVPVDSDFKNNLISHSSGRDTFTIYDDISGIRFSGNLLNDVPEHQIESGFESLSIELERASNGLMYPSNPDLAEIGIAKDFQPISKNETGTSWYAKPEGLVEFGSGKTVEISAEESLSDAIENASPGDVLSLAAGDYFVSKILKVTSPITIASAAPISDGTSPSVSIEFERGALFEIQDGGSLAIKGLSISGKSAPDSAGNAVVRTQRGSMLMNYRLLVEDSRIEDLDVNHSFDFLSVAKSTLADSIVIRNSHFRNITGAILKLDAENDDNGIFNSDYVTITDSSFTDVEKSLIDFYRGGTDESTFGPHFSLSDSMLTNVGHGSRNKSSSSMLLHGVQVSDISDNQIVDSLPIVLKHTVGEPVTKIHSNLFVSTPPPSVEELNSDKENTAHIYDNEFE